MKDFIKKYWLYGAYALVILACKNCFDGMLAVGIFAGTVFTLNPLVCGAVCLVNALFYGIDGFVCTSASVGVLWICFYVHKLFKKRILRWLFAVYVACSCAFYCIYHTSGYFELFDKLLNSALCIALSFTVISAVRVAKRGFGYKVSLDDKIALSVFGVVFSYCLSKITLGGFALVEFFAPLLVLFCVSAFGSSVGFCVSATLGIGNLLALGTFDYLGFLFLATCVAVLFHQINCYVSALSYVVCDVLVKSISSVEIVVLNFLPAGVGALLFVLVPRKIVNYVSACGGTSAERITANTILNKMRLGTAKRLFRLSEVFLSMKNTFLTMAAEETVEKDACKVIVRQISDTVCTDCKQRTNCWRNNIASTEKSFLTVATTAVGKGKCTILDAPQSLSVACSRLPAVLSEANTLAERFANKKARIQTSNQSKMLIGEEMGGVSGVLGKLAGEMKGKIVFDNQTEREITEMLAFHNVKCAGTVLLTDGNSVELICTVSEGTYSEDAVTQIVGKCVKHQVEVARIEKATDGWLNVFLQKKPLFDVTLGVRSVTKHGSTASGDTHSFVKTDNGKCILAVCDGMGSGTVAEKMSTTSISLVENFYRAGFDNDVILSCVNKLLAKTGNEVFCAVDVCALDLTSGLADFIKLGATSGLVRHGDTVEIVSGSSLPLGVLEEMKPSVTKKALASGDDVVLLSDGVADCFRDVNLLAKTFCEARFTNPQSVADYIVEKALAICHGKNADDMTVLVAHLV